MVLFCLCGFNLYGYGINFMHIAFVANTSWSMYRFRTNILRHLIKQGHTVSIIAPFDDSISQLSDMGCDCIHVNMHKQGTNPLQDIYLTYQLFNIYKKIKPDLLFHYTIKPNIYGSIAAKFAKIKNCIAVTTGLGSAFIGKIWVAKIVELLYRYALLNASYVAFLNQYDQTVFIQKKIIPVTKAWLLPSEGIDTEFFSPKSMQERVADIYAALPINHANNLSIKTIRFLLIARMLKDKGIIEYLQSAKVLKEKYGDVINFYILGAFDPDNPSAINTQDIQIYLNKGIVKYLGVVADVRPFIYYADCIVLPSYAEGISRSLLEGACMEKPLIATNVAGCVDIVEDAYNGYLCQAKSYASLVMAIEKFIHLSTEDKIIMGKNSRQVVIEKFSDEKVIQCYDDLMHRINLHVKH